MGSNQRPADNESAALTSCPVEASREIAEALPSGVGRLDVIARTGHFPWLDAPERYWPVIEGLIAQQDSAAS